MPLSQARLIAAAGGFVLLLLMEAVWPFRKPVESRRRRYVINFFILGSNALLLNIVLGSLVVSSFQLFESRRLGLLRAFDVTGWINALSTVVVLDGITYLWHRAYHTVPVMWRMHRVHHSDLDLDVTSSGRFHLTEMILSALFRLAVIAALGASFAGVVIFEITFCVANQIGHSNIRIPQPVEDWLRTVFVTPDMHRIHHSQEKIDTNSNFSTIFSWWDRLFGTYRFGMNQQSLVIGLPEYSRPADVALEKVLVMPFGAPCQ